MEFDFNKLRGRIIEKMSSQSALATHLGMTKSQISGRLNNKVPFCPDEIHRMCLPDCLDIAPEEIGVYFFTPKVR